MRLQTRLVGVTLPLAFCAGALIVGLADRAVENVLVAGLAERGIAELDEDSASAAAGIQAPSEARLLPVLSQIRAKLGAEYAMALATSGEVIAHTNVVERGKTYGDAASARALGGEGPVVQRVSYHSRALLDVAIPVWAPDEDFVMAQEKGGRHRLGTLRVGIPLAPLEAVRLSIVRRIVLILLITGGAMLGALLLLLRWILAPVALLADVSRRIAHGDYGATVPVRSSDELGRLSATFNDMSRQLQLSAESMLQAKEREVAIAGAEARLIAREEGARALKRAYEQLRLFRSIIDQSQDAICVLDAETGRFLDFNDKACSALGYSREEFAAMAVCNVMAQAPDAAWWENHVAEVKSRGFKVFEASQRRKDGTAVPVEISCKYVSLEKPFLLAVIRDVAERKKLERIAVQSEKMAAVGQLAAGVAHEINNPLGIILGFAEGVARRVKEDDVFYTPLKSIEREAIRCKNLVQKLLTFSRQGSGKSELFDVDSAVADALALVKTQARVKSIALTEKLEPCGVMTGDRTQIQQAVINLCTNAIDALADGGRLTVSTSRETKDARSWIILKVSDTGSGIPEAILDKIFDPFFTTKEPGKGTGLGLALVLECVKKHGGEIEVDTKVGTGTTFTIRLPGA